MRADADLLAQRALWAGQHALAILLGLLALLLAATCIGWWALRRSAVSERSPALAPRFGLHPRIAAGLTLMLLGAAVFAALATQLGTGNRLLRFDQAFTDALRASAVPPVLQVFTVLTHLGDTATLTGLCLVIALALVIGARRGLALGWVLTVAGNGLLNQTLKQIFSRVRPLDPDGVVLEHGFSFPSGHSSGALVVYGMLAYLALRVLPPRWHLPALVAALTLALVVGASRLFLRVHFASDVIAGFASGTAWLTLCITVLEILRWRGPLAAARTTG